MNYPFVVFIAIFNFLCQLKKIDSKYYLILFLSLHELRILYVTLSVIHFKSETFETNLFITCTSIKMIRKDNTISIFNFIYIFHLNF
jgi:hypothetical protein